LQGNTSLLKEDCAQIDLVDLIFVKDQQVPQICNASISLEQRRSYLSTMKAFHEQIQKQSATGDKHDSLYPEARHHLLPSFVELDEAHGPIAAHQAKDPKGKGKGRTA
jgi:hypothetical protein